MSLQKPPGVISKIIVFFTNGIFRNLNLYLPIYFIIILDLLLTLGGQPAEYWEGFRNVNESNPLGIYLLLLSPLMLVFGVFCYILLIHIIFKLLKKPYSLFFESFVFLAHCVACSLWLIYYINKIWANHLFYLFAITIYIFFIMFLASRYWYKAATKTFNFKKNSNKLMTPIFVLIILNSVLNLAQSNLGFLLETTNNLISNIALIVLFSIVYIFLVFVLMYIIYKLISKLDGLLKLIVASFIFMVEFLLSSNSILPIYKSITGQEYGDEIYWWIMMGYILLVTFFCFLYWYKGLQNKPVVASVNFSKS